jgi:hypothetical protein
MQYATVILSFKEENNYSEKQWLWEVKQTNPVQVHFEL